MYSKADFRVGQYVYFGRRNGEQTLGVIRKLNPTKAKIETLESRGRSHERHAGVVWSVPYSLMRPADSAAPIQGNYTPPESKEPLTYSPFDHTNNLILTAILDCYAGLSPENLSCDGEASMAHIRSTRNELNRKLRGLFLALGREVDEGEIYDWNKQRQEYDRQRGYGNN